MLLFAALNSLMAYIVFPARVERHRQSYLGKVGPLRRVIADVLMGLVVALTMGAVFVVYFRNPQAIDRESRIR